MPTPSIRVVCAIIQNAENPHTFLVAQRPFTDLHLPGKWEFPGGKIETGEEETTALLREIQEELGVPIEVGQRLTPVVWHYPCFHITLIPYLSKLNRNALQRLEHHELRWVSLEVLDQLDWAPADTPILEELRGMFLSGSPSKDSVV